ncbi:hypothetical protein F7P69_17530 [Cellulosimicrobium funkei]|nr:hypothetical protein [Cellulosimicrobium funkei]
MSIERRGGIPRRTWRAAVAVFLGVFLGGLSVSGATALWSQNAEVTTSVTTGTWTTAPAPGWEWTPEITATVEQVEGRQTIRLDWTAPEYTGPHVTYRTTFQGGGPAQSGSVTAPATSYVVDYVGDGQFMFTVVAFVDGVPSHDVVRTGIITREGDVVMH